MSGQLRRFWFEFDLPDPERSSPGMITLDGETLSRRLLWRGCGATGADEADCLKLIAALIAPDKLPPISRVVPDVDIAALAAGVRAEIGVVVWRGVWFPRGSSAWSPPTDA
jgi:hypothetical protein